MMTGRKGVPRVSVTLCLSYPARLAAMFFNQDLNDIRQLILPTLATTSSLWRVSVISDFIVWMVKRIRAYCQGVDAFFLLLDDLTEIEKLVNKKFNDIDDISSVLHYSTIRLWHYGSAIPLGLLWWGSILHKCSPRRSIWSTCISQHSPQCIGLQSGVSRIWSPPAIIKERRATQIQALTREELFELEIIEATIMPCRPSSGWGCQRVLRYLCMWENRQCPKV